MLSFIFIPWENQSIQTHVRQVCAENLTNVPVETSLNQKKTELEFVYNALKRRIDG